jgi:phosphoglucomutase
MNHRYEAWKTHAVLDSHTQSQLLNLTPSEIEECFGAHVEFGTAGMRGLLGPGPNRLNLVTIRKATVGFVSYIKRIQEDDESLSGVAIAYDNRTMSREFAYESAATLASYGITSYVYESLRSTPQLSFTVRELKCAGGIMITASHNPKEYNGFKVYDKTGCQLVPKDIDQVIKAIGNIQDELAIVVADHHYLSPLIRKVDPSVDKLYQKKVIDIALRPEVNKDIKIVFTSVHGAGYPVVPDVLTTSGYHVINVEDQIIHDPLFSNTKSPNPEEAIAYERAIEVGLEHDAHILLCTDPDADRMGVVVKHQGNYQLLSGNQTGAIIIEYLLSTLKEKHLLKEKSVIFNTIVTSDLPEKVAEHYGVEVEKTLTVFKFIGEKIEEYSKTKEKHFVLGFEESYGYLVESFVRDKDAVQACLLLAEAAAYYASKQQTLVDVLDMLTKRHGYYYDTQTSLTLKGIEGRAKIKAIMKGLRDHPLTHIGPLKVIKQQDYDSLIETIDGVKTPLKGFVNADVLKYFLENGSWVAVRPSGTEPKCKFYYCVKGDTQREAEELFEQCQSTMASVVS